jgi:hypothetical protein
MRLWRLRTCSVQLREETRCTIYPRIEAQLHGEERLKQPQIQDSHMSELIGTLETFGESREFIGHNYRPEAEYRESSHANDPTLPSIIKKPKSPIVPQLGPPHHPVAPSHAVPQQPPEQQLPSHRNPGSWVEQRSAPPLAQ